MIYILLGAIIFLLFVWDICLFAHDRKISEKLDDIHRELLKHRKPPE